MAQLILTLPDLNHSFKSVAVAGSFNDWNALSTKLKYNESTKNWEIDLSWVDDDKIYFKFVVDDHDWICNDQLDIEFDESGNSNNVISIPATKPSTTVKEDEKVPVIIEEVTSTTTSTSTSSPPTVAEETPVVSTSSTTASVTEKAITHDDQDVEEGDGSENWIKLSKSEIEADQTQINNQNEEEGEETAVEDNEEKSDDDNEKEQEKNRIRKDLSSPIASANANGVAIPSTSSSSISLYFQKLFSSISWFFNYYIVSLFTNIFKKEKTPERSVESVDEDDEIAET